MAICHFKSTNLVVVSIASLFRLEWELMQPRQLFKILKFTVDRNQGTNHQGIQVIQGTQITEEIVDSRRHQPMDGMVGSLLLPLVVIGIGTRAAAGSIDERERVWMSCVSATLLPSPWLRTLYSNIGNIL